MKTLITGGAGFIGSHLAKFLLGKGHDVVIIDNLSGGFEKNIPNGAIFYNIDICDKERIDQLFQEEKFDYVYHLAAYAAEGLSHFIRNYNYMDNLIGSINIINGCVKYKVKHMVFTSSMAVYGTNQTPYREDMIPSPEDPYGVAKLAVEQDLKCAREMFGLNYTIFRPHNVVGTKQNIGDSYRNVVGIFLNQIMKGEPMTIFGDGSQVRAFSYIEDMLPYFEQSIHNPKANGEIFNIGGEVPYTIKELTDEIKKITPSAKIVNEPPRVEVHTAFSDHSKLYKIFGKLSELTTIDTWLPEFMVWCKKIGPQPTTRFDGVELLDNLPPKWKKLLKE